MLYVFRTVTAGCPLGDVTAFFCVAITADPKAEELDPNFVLLAQIQLYVPS